MSLIHWWPLNGNLKDYGCGTPVNLSFSKSNFTFDNNGKIGKCINLDSVGKATCTIPELVDKKVFTLSAWVYCYGPTSVSGKDYSSQAWANLFAFWDYGDKVRFESAYSSPRVLSYHNNSQNKFFSSSGNTIIPSSEYDKWVHFAFVCDGTNTRAYRNGTLVFSSSNNVQSNAALQGTFGINDEFNESNSYGYHGKINDVRIYDHALSLKEVKEISKGLVLHYTFEDVYAEGTTNLFAGRTDFSNTSHWPRNQINSTAPTVDSEGNMKLYGYATDGNHQSYTFSKNAGYTSISASTTYTLSVLVKYSSTSAYFNMYFYEQNSSGTATKTNSWRIGCTAQEVGHWVLRSKTITTQSTTTRMYAELNCYNCPSTDYIIMKNNTVQLEAKDHATPFVNGTRAAGLIYDSSGYGYNGAPINNPQIIKDSGCGMHCVNLTNASNGYYDLGTATFNFITSGTVCFWAKYVDSNYKMILGANDSGSKYLAANTPNGSSSSGNWYGMVSTSNCYCDGEVYSKPKIDSQWHFYCFTGINFSSWGDLKYFLCIYANNPNNSFQFHGYLADFKIFATTLSAEDILKEYNRKASIDRDGNLYTGEFVEENDRINIAKTDVIEASVFEEGTSLVKMTDKYVELEYIQSSGSQYIDTGYIPNVNSVFFGKFMHTEHVVDTPLYGVRTSNYGNSYTFWAHPSEYSAAGKNTAIFNGYQYQFPIGYSEGTIETFYCSKSILQSNNQIHKYTASSGSPNLSLIIFGLSNGGSIDSRKFIGRMYEFTILEGSSLVRNFVPAKRKSDNVIGMYDTVNRQFYTNSGSGSFTAGPEKGNLSIVYSKQIIEN